MTFALVSMWTMVLLGAALTGMKLTAAVWLHRQKSPATWVILIGAAICTVADLVQIALMDSRGFYDPELRWFLELTVHSQTLGDFIFITGFVMFAARLRGEWKRIAELEEVLHDPHRSVPPDEEK